MPALSNRYPASSSARPVRQSRPRPLPKPFPKPDNDNTPGNRKPRPLPDNDNRPGRPLNIPRGSSAARLLARRSLYGLLAMAAGALIKEYLADWIYTNLQSAAMAPWKQDFRCKSGKSQWDNGNFVNCLVRQVGLAPYPTVYHYMKATNYLATDLNQWFGPYPHPFAPTVPAWDLAANYSRAINNQTLPELDNVPWPEYLPLPDPDVWPVGMPYPVTSPWVRPIVHPAAGGKNTRDSSSPGTRYRKETAFDPFPRRPRKGEKETKIRGEQLYAVFGRGLSTYSEFGDFIDSLWDALDPYYQTNRYGEFRYKGRRTPHLGEKFNDIYHNLDRMDWNQAVENLILNEIQDQIIGRLIGRTTKVFGPNLGNALVRGTGFGL